MSEELRPCPFCGGKFRGANGFWTCETDADKCPISCLKIYSSEIISAYCWKEIDRLNERVKELEGALMDMVAQHCYEVPENCGDRNQRYFSNALHANADSMRLLGKLGLMKIDDRGMRIVYGWWSKDEGK